MEPIEAMLQGMAMTLQGTISELGLVPNEHGDMVKEILGSDGAALIIALGCHLDRCREEGSYKSLDKLKEEMENRKVEDVGTSGS